MGDGICLAVQAGDVALWRAVGSAGFGAEHLLLAAFHQGDVLGWGSGGHFGPHPRVRVSRMRIVAPVDGLALLAGHWRDADLRGMAVTLPGWAEPWEAGDAVMAGATWDELLSLEPDCCWGGDYVTCRRAGLSHTQVLEAIAARSSLRVHAHAVTLGASHEEVLAARAVSPHLHLLVEGLLHDYPLAHLQQVLQVAGANDGLIRQYLHLRRHGRHHAFALFHAVRP